MKSNEIRLNKPLRVGFDLDGVLLYNPVRIVRPLVAFVKNLFLHKSKLSFYYPKTPLEKLFWTFVHRSSLFVAPGFEEIRNLTKNKKIIPYLVSSRFSFLKDDFEVWLEKTKAESFFSACYHNTQDEQPHLFKEKMVKKLELDIFVEDNWDIVRHLNEKLKIKNENVKIFWICNLFDNKIDYPYKFPSLKKAIEFIKK